MTHLFQLQTLAIKRRQNLKLNEVEALLNALPSATLILDPLQRNIISVNSKVIELTSYSRSELYKTNPDQLFTLNGAEQPFTSYILNPQDQPYTIDIVNHSGEKIPSTVTLTPILTNRNLILITIQPESGNNRQSTPDIRQDQLWVSWLSLSNASLDPDLTSAIEMVLQAGYHLTNATCVCLYQANSQMPMLQRSGVFGTIAQLPEQLQPQDLLLLQQFTLWVYGNRVSSSLHRMARVSHFKYLASIPIGQPNAWIGLLVIAGNQVPPPQPLENILDVLANQITSLIQGHTLISGLQNELNKHVTTESIYKILQDSIQYGMILLSPELKILSVNHSAEKALGYSYHEIVEQSIQDILISTSNLTSSYRAAQEGIPSDLIENIKIYRRDGQIFPAQIQILPVMIENILHRVIILFNDLSKQEQYRELNQQLEQRALLGEVTASFAHEVRNPINNISTGLQLLGFNLPPDDPNQENIRRLQNDCERLAELVKSSLLFVRPMEYKMEAIDVSRLLSGLLDRMHTRLERAKIKHHTKFEKDLPAVEADARALEQVFTNLINNAIQAMEPAGGVLAIQAKKTSNMEGSPQVEISISDTGPGIPPEIRDRVFEPFFTTKPSGTGLGLAIVKRIITAHKGAIRVNSVTGGTIFSIELPAVR